MILHYEGEFTISLMCRVLSVSRSGYYSWKNRKPSKRQQRREQFELLIKDTYEDELADALIRLLDHFAAIGASPDVHVTRKMQYNSLRPYKHNKKY